MIINQFGFQILKLVEKGLQFNQLVAILSGKNSIINNKLEKDIRDFFMEMIIKKVIPFHEAKRYLSLQETISPKKISRDNDILSPIIYQKIGSNYLVYITCIPNIMLVNKTGLKIAQLYFDGMKKEQIVQRLQQEYENCSKEQLMKDVNEFLSSSELL